MNRNKKPLYRKVNTKAKGVHHHFGGDYSTNRHSKNNVVGMSKGKRRGLDYTPLFKFLLSKVGQPWDKVHSEAVSRLDREEPIYYIVSLDKSSAKDVVLVGESSYFSGLFVDEQGILQLTAPHIGPGDLEPSCACCTHSLNGKVFTKKYRG
ncbi:hypothetical protein [Candidatus Uabimicrobium amorphum]|nr:hypothetical protein [Candidatus Uabimicrobium amorphum]